MPFDVINTGTTANDGTGDPLRTAFTKVNDNTAKTVEAPTGAVTADTVVLFDGTTGKLVKGGGKVNADLVTGPASATSGRVAVYNGTTGKLLQDGAKLEADLVVGPALATADAIAVYDSTTGKLIKDSGVTVQQLVDGLIGKFTWDSATTSPASSVSRGVPPALLENLYDKIKGCVLNADGSVNYYLNPSDWSLKETGGSSVLTGADGNVMVEIPKFYYRISRSGTETTWEISPAPLSGFTVHPAFIKDGVEVSHRYYGAYDACLKFERSITAVADAGGGDITVTVSAQHPLYAGDSVTIAGTTSYNGTFTVVSRPSGTTFTVTAAFVATETGTASGFASGKNLDNSGGNTPGASNDLLASVKGIYPMVGLNRAEFRARAGNLNSGGVTGWRQLDFHLWSAVGLLYLVEYQTFYNQDELGAGNTNGSYLGSSDSQNDSPHTIAGAGDVWANGSTDGTQLSAGAKPGTAFMRYRGIENLYGNCWNWADGININVSATGNVHITNNAANWADNTSTNYTLATSTLATTSANIQTLLAVDPWFLAATTGGTSAQYVTDRHFGSSSSNRVAAVGGSAGNGSDSGVFALVASDVSSSRNRSVGGRLAR
jgi:hypothetical protein